MTPSLLNPLAALGPIAWDRVDHAELDSLVADTFACAQLIADSIPADSGASALGHAGRPRSHTDGAVSYGVHAHATATPGPAADNGGQSRDQEREKVRQDLRRAWKQVSASGSNPRGIAVYKMNGGRDGYPGSSWFARRSIHRVEKAKPATPQAAGGSAQDIGIGFDMFRRALLREFAIHGQDPETGNNAGAPAAVRTMITKKRVEHLVLGGQHENDENDESKARQLDVYLLEAFFPGPTAARDFVTMLLTAQSAASPLDSHGLRQFMLVSKPCEHPATPRRKGYVRAQYESVEMIREVRVPVAEGALSAKPAAAATRKTRSSIDLARDSLDNSLDTHETAIEWLMVTRNNPGGSVPRFLVDKSTPSSIISDANKFMDWMVACEVDAARQSSQNAAKDEESQPSSKSTAPSAALAPAVHGIPEEAEDETKDETDRDREPTHGPADDSRSTAPLSSLPDVAIVPAEGTGGAASSAKLFSMFAGALGGAGTVVASKLPNPFGYAAQALGPSLEGRPDSDSGDDDDDDDDDDSSGDSYSDIDGGDESGQGARGRRESTHQATEARETPDAVDEPAPGPGPASLGHSRASSSVSSFPSFPSVPSVPPPTTALELLAHSKAMALHRLNDSPAVSLSTGGSSQATTDSENDTETGLSGVHLNGHGSHGAAAGNKRTDDAAATAKAAESALKRHERELKKLLDRQRKAEEAIWKASKSKTSLKGSLESTEAATERSAPGTPGHSNSASSSGSSVPYTEPPSSAAQKLGEKQDRAVARREAKYQKEMEKLERKRQQQAEKDAARLRKQQEREEKADTARQLVHARAERDVARKEKDVLADRVRQLEAEKEMLAAELARR